MILRQGVSLAASLRCPKCQSQYVLEQLIREQLPQWEIVDDPTPNLPVLSASDSSNHIVQVPQSDDELELQLEPEEFSTSPATPPANHVSAHSQPQSRASAPGAKVDWSKFKPITHEEYERNRRKSTSPLWQIIQVVLGGVAAIPVSLLLIWHVVGTDIGNAGPTVAKYAPWLVPERLRPQLDEDLPQITQLGDQPTDLPLDHLDRVDDAHNANENSVTPSIPSAEDPLQSPAADNQVDSSVRSARDSTETNNLFSQIGAFERCLAEWELGKDGDRTQRRKLAQSLYGSLTELANQLESVSETDPTQRTIRQKVDSCVTKLVGSESAQTVISAGAKAQLASARSDTSKYLAMIVKVDRLEEIEADRIVYGTPQATGTVAIPPIRIPRREFAKVANLTPGRKLLVLGKDFRLPVDTKTDAAPKEAEFQAIYAYSW